MKKNTSSPNYVQKNIDSDSKEMSIDKKKEQIQLTIPLFLLTDQTRVMEMVPPTVRAPILNNKTLIIRS